MVQVGRGRGYPEEERLPWLDDFAPKPAARAAPARRLFVAMALALLVVGGIIAGTLWWWHHRSGGMVEGALITAPPGPYKIKPVEPGGMTVEGKGFASYEASEGVDPAGRLNLGATPEAPVKRGPPDPAAPPPEPEIAPGAGGGTVQLGAFSTEAKANAAWKALAQRFRWLDGFTPVVLPARVGDATVYRLRTHAGSNAQRICGRMKVAGETCAVVG